MALKLIKFDEDRAQHQIKLLEEKRQGIAEALEAFRLAWSELYHREPFREELEKWFEITSPKDAEIEAVKAWMQVDGIDLPLKPENVSQAMDLKKEITSAVRAWENAYNVSSDPWSYWSDTKQAFKNIPVSKEEKEAIQERNKYYVGGEGLEKAFVFVEMFCEILNHANRLGQEYTPGQISLNLPFLQPFIMATPGRSELGLTRYHFSPKRDVLLAPGERFQAFDE